jgi:hypothetical protein
LETRVGSVEMISSSKPWMLTASWIAASGSCTPTMGSTGAPAASSSSGSASSIVASASERPWSSGSTSWCRPCAEDGTSNVNAAGPRAARSRTASRSAGVAAVRLATTRTRAVAPEDSMGLPFVR